jgi:3-oxoadipate enol-lactonase
VGLAEPAVPVTVVVGDRDLAATRLWARRIAARTPGATLTELPAADHVPMLSAPDAFERLVRSVL